MIYSSNTENMVLILSRYQTTIKCKEESTPLKDITINDIWPTLKIAAANADVVIIKEGSIFKVLKHHHMVSSALYHIYHHNALYNICFANQNKAKEEWRPQHRLVR